MTSAWLMSAVVAVLVAGGVEPNPTPPEETPPSPPAAPAEPATVTAPEPVTPPLPPEAQIAAVLDDFHDAASKADFERYFSHWTDRSVFLGTDATERWVGEEFREFARPHFEDGRGWTYAVTARRISAASERVAFFDELLTNEKLGKCRGSGVVAIEGGRWVVLQYNLSIPVPNAIAEAVAGQIRAREVEGGDVEDK